MKRKVRIELDHSSDRHWWTAHYGGDQIWGSATFASRRRAREHLRRFSSALFEAVKQDAK